MCTPVSFFKVRELRPPGTVNKKSAAGFMISRRRTVTVREASRRRLGKEAGRESFGEGGWFFFGLADLEVRLTWTEGWRM